VSLHVVVCFCTSCLCHVFYLWHKLPHLRPSLSCMAGLTHFTNCRKLGRLGAKLWFFLRTAAACRLNQHTISLNQPTACHYINEAWKQPDGTVPHLLHIPAICRTYNITKQRLKPQCGTCRPPGLQHQRNSNQYPPRADSLAPWGAMHHSFNSHTMSRTDHQF
jgi:hypothetical protein